MEGKRVADNTFHHQFEPGNYSKVLLNGKITWFIMTPNGIHGNLANHKCIEESDGTLTVPPPGRGEGANSILAEEYVGDRVTKKWHGFMDHGIWKEC